MSVAGARRRVVVGLDQAPPPPMQLGAPGTPEFRGLEVDLLAALTAALGWDPVYEVALWSELLDRLASGGLDLVCTAATVTAERSARFEFSTPYLEMSLVGVVREDGRAADLGGLAAGGVAIRPATPAAAWAERHLRGARLERFDTNEEAYGALRSGAVDVLIDDSPIASWFVRTIPGLRIVAALPDTESEYAMVFARGSGPLLAGVNAALEGLIRSGALARIRGRWLDTP